MSYKYNISIVASSNYLPTATNTLTSLKTSIVPNTNQYQTANASATSPDPAVITYNLLGLGQSTFYPQGSSGTFNIPQFTVPSGSTPNVFMIWTGGSTGTNNLVTFNISKITIVAVAPPSFALYPQTIPISCGDQTPQTLTVAPTNAAAAAATVTSYQWNLGGSNNGWLLPNGTPASATITTAPNGSVGTLQLIPVCGVTPNPITASAIISSAAYNTNTASVTYYQPSLSIIGKDNLCSGSTIYTINGLPCGANVSWSLSSSGIVTYDCLNCSQITLTKQQEGNVTLTATVTNTCGFNLAPISKNISTVNNPPIEGTYILTSNGNWVLNGYQTLNNNGYPVTVYVNRSQICNYGIFLSNTGLTNVSWTVSGACSNITSSNNNFNCTLPAPGYGGASGITVYLQATGPCGTTINQSYSIQILANPGSNVIISPNPAKDNVTVSMVSNSATGSTNSTNQSIMEQPNNIATDLSNAKQNKVKPNAAIESAKAITTIEFIKVFDDLGKLRKTLQFSKGSQRVQINVKDLAPGIYYLQIFDGYSYTRNKLLVQR